MKKSMKTMVAAVCVVASVGGFKAYIAANQSEADMLLAENVEALTWTEYDAQTACINTSCPWTDRTKYCNWICPGPGQSEGTYYGKRQGW